MIFASSVSVCKGESCLHVCFGGILLFTCVVVIFFEWVFCCSFAGRVNYFLPFCFQFACLDKEIKTILLHYV